jgi:hypothetical protein
MGGGLLQLVAYGAQDVYLTGNPQITFFKVVYRRHTNFSMEAIQQTFNGTVGFDKTVTAQISRNGDLIHKMYLEVELDALHAPVDLTTYDLLATNYDRYVNYVGLRLIDSVTLEIGGQQIDKQYSDWMYIWNELSLPDGKRTGWDEMVGADSDMTSFGLSSSKKSTLYIPFEFWFCRNVGLALPLIALQYHEVKLNIKFATLAQCTYNGTSYTRNVGTLDGAVSYQAQQLEVLPIYGTKANPSDPDGPEIEDRDNVINQAQVRDASPERQAVMTPFFKASLWVDYVFLDTDERRRFAQMSHEYLIEQVQFTGSEQIPSSTSAEKLKLNFNHPVKEIIWYVQEEKEIFDDFQWYNYTKSDNCNYIESNRSAMGANPNVFLTNTVYGITPQGTNMVDTAILQLNGNDRFSIRDGDYFSLVQPYQHHTNVPTNAGINMYSFGLKPEEHQPSGTLNMSRIDTATLAIKSHKPGKCNVFATNYNVLRILSGMGGLAYSN